MTELMLSNEAVREMIIQVFGAGLVTGMLIFLLAHGISGALKILKA